MRSCSKSSTDRNVGAGNLRWDDPTEATVAAQQPSEDFRTFLLPSTTSPQAGGPLPLPAEDSGTQYIPGPGGLPGGIKAGGEESSERD